MTRLWLHIKLFFNLYRIAKNPENTAAVLTLGPCLYKLGYTQQAIAKVTSDPKNVEVLKSRRLMPVLNLQELKLCSSGSLGAVFAQHMLKNNLNPEFYGRFEVSNDETFFMMRMRQTHDLWHVMTGFSTSVDDELGLLAFIYAQTQAPLVPLLIGGAILKVAFSKNIRAPAVFERISTGYQMGMTAKSLFSIDWEANWSTPLRELRLQYEIRAQDGIELS